MTITVQDVIANEIRKATTPKEMEENAVAAAVAFAKAEAAYAKEANRLDSEDSSLGPK